MTGKPFKRKILRRIKQTILATANTTFSLVILIYLQFKFHRASMDIPAVFQARLTTESITSYNLF